MGGSGIYFFLVLSGFSLTHSLTRKARTGQSSSAFRYLFERWIRVAPPYYAAIFLYLATAAVQQAIHHQPFTVEGGLYRQILVHLLFMHGFWSDTIYAISIPLWFLSTLFQLYLIFPLLFKLAERYGYQFVVPVSIAISLSWRWFVTHGLVGQTYLVDGVFLGRLGAFAMGMGVAAWFNRPDRPAASRLLSPICLACAAVFLTAAFSSVPPYKILLGHTAFGAGFSAILVAALASDGHHGLFSRVCSSAPLVWTGKISYSLYLVHALALDWIAPIYRRVIPHHSALTDDLFLVAAFGLILGLGWLFYGIMEAPVNKRSEVRRLAAARTAAVGQT
jgi:peptidoglycan/LPS O-acetylase OafA/YrhL